MHRGILTKDLHSCGVLKSSEYSAVAGDLLGNSSSVFATLQTYQRAIPTWCARLTLFRNPSFKIYHLDQSVLKHHLKQLLQHWVFEQQMWLRRHEDGRSWPCKMLWAPDKCCQVLEHLNFEVSMWSKWFVDEHSAETLLVCKSLILSVK